MTFLSRIGRFLGLTRTQGMVLEETVVEELPVDVHSNLGLGQIAFAAKTNQNTVMLFMGTAPMSYTLGMLMAHTPAICSIVRNMALMLSIALPANKDFFYRMANHGNIKPTQEPFAPVVPDDPMDDRTAFVAELSYYEVAQMCMCITDTHRAFQEAGLQDKKSTATFEFWDKIWLSLPDSVKMSVLNTGGSKVAN